MVGNRLPMEPHPFVKMTPVEKVCAACGRDIGSYVHKGQRSMEQMRSEAFSLMEDEQLERIKDTCLDVLEMLVIERRRRQQATTVEE